MDEEALLKKLSGIHSARLDELKKENENLKALVRTHQDRCNSVLDLGKRLEDVPALITKIADILGYVPQVEGNGSVILIKKQKEKKSLKFW
jgi:hypothetical protein